MKSRVGVILNTQYHAETAMSVYFSLNRLPDYEPILVALEPDRLGLQAFLSEIGVRKGAASSSPEEFDRTIVITAYPPRTRIDNIPNSKHPLVKGLPGKRILLSHRCNHPRSVYGNENVMCLSPIGETYGNPFIYLCAVPTPLSSRPLCGSKKFLVQGRIRTRPEDFDWLKAALKANPKSDCEVICFGRQSPMADFDDDRVRNESRVLSERDFYDLCGSVDFVLPLLRPSTLGGTYVKERFSTSFGISFSGEKPLLVHQDLSDIYGTPSEVYASQEKFISQFERCCTMATKDYEALLDNCSNFKQRAHLHNDRVLSKLLD